MDTTFEVEKQDKGFTLVELLIVIVILGILATVTVIAVNGITDDATAASCTAEAAAVETAAAAFYASSETQDWPASIDALVTAGYLRDAPTNTITYDATTGRATCPAPGAPADGG
jgi:prepilin-type N-terminal cleavage/methylation domain-containing protein